VAALFAVGSSALMLLFTGIHNSWDTVTYIAVERKKPRGSGDREKEEGRPKEG
jgi:hypothetical protein